MIATACFIGALASATALAFMLPRHEREKTPRRGAPEGLTFTEEVRGRDL